ncbi:hypothetical protein [Spirosoma aerophilum]
MYTTERVHLALPLALLFVKAMLRIKEIDANPIVAPANVFRTPEAAESYDKECLEYAKRYKEQGDERKNKLEMLERMDAWNDENRDRSLRQLLDGHDHEYGIKVIVTVDETEYVVFTDDRGKLAYDTNGGMD